MPSSTSRQPLADILTKVFLMSLVTGGALVALVVCGVSASAHAEVVRITPAANAHVTAAPTKIVVEFNEPVSTRFAAVLVTSERGLNVVRGAPTVSGGTLTQTLRSPIPAGSYRIAYRVTSDDGHPVSGQSGFTLTSATAASAATSPPRSPSSQGPGMATPSATGSAASSPVRSPADQRSPLTRFVLPISGSAVLLLGGAGLLLRERRRR